MKPSCEIIRSETINIARLHGRIDGSVAQETRQMMTDAGFADHSHLLISLADVSFIDSMGLGLIASLAKGIRARGGEIVLYGMSDQVRSSFEMARMHLIFDIFDNEETARNWVS